jgi:hypothetical protein
MADATIIVGQSIKLRSRATGGLAVSVAHRVNWAVDDPAVLQPVWPPGASVGDNQFHGRAPGTAIVTATLGALAATYSVEVLAADLITISGSA